MTVALPSQEFLPWRSDTSDYPRLARAVERGLEYVVWEQPSLRYPGVTTYTVSQRRNVQRRIRELQRHEDVATVDEAFYQAQCWAWEEAGIDIHPTAGV